LENYTFLPIGAKKLFLKVRQDDVYRILIEKTLQLTTANVNNEG
jgi:hypothetical protein